MNILMLKEKIQNGEYDSLIKDIYVDDELLSYQRERYIEALEQYEKYFGKADVNIFSAAGRSEVCGNHTDHQHGSVLATSVNLDVIAVATANNSNTVSLISKGYRMETVDLSDLSVNKKEYGTTAAIIKGVAKGLSDCGYKIGGFNAYTTSDVIVGAGLSSSAAFEDVVGVIISGLFNNMEIDAVTIAKISQFAENVYFGKPCGLMDQTACAVGGMINIDFEDPTKPIVKKIDVEFEKYNYSLCIIDTKGSHADLTDDYAQILSEMKGVANYFGKDYLRECSEEEFYKNYAKIREKAGDRAMLRAAHFFNEQKNVENGVTALRNGDFEGFLNVIKRSGNSSFKYLQNVYTVRKPHQQSVSIALSLSEQILGENGVSRVHGGGFAGTIQAFVKNDFVKEYKEFIESVFGNGSCHVLKIRPYGAIKVI